MLKKKNYLGLLLTFIISAFFLVPFVFAEKYFEVGDVTMNGELIEYHNYSQEYYNDREVYDLDISDTGEFEMEVVAVDLDENKNYVLSLKSDYIDETETYSGAELNDGVTITIDDAKSTIDLTIKEQGTNNYVYFKYTQYCFENDEWCEPIKYYDVLPLYFDDTQNFTEVEAVFNRISKNGKIKVNTIDLGEEFYETSISTALRMLDLGRFDAWGGCYEGECEVYIEDTENSRHAKSYQIVYEFAKADRTIKAKLDKYAKKFNFTFENIEDNLFSLVDLENLNYKYATLNSKSEISKINAIINYSSELHKLFENENLSVALDTRAGWDEEFTTGGFGYLNIIYDGVVYAVAEPVGIKQINVMYIPNGTAKTRAAYIAAAKERIESYLKNVNVEISYAGQIADIDTDDWMYPLEKLIDVSKTTGEYYNVKLNNTTFKFFIEEGTEKMNTPFMNTKDIETNIYITSDAYGAPLDGKISVDVLDEKSAEYKDLMKKLKLIKGMAVDLKLFSNTLDMYVTKLDDGNFKVYIPLDSAAAKKDYIAYYYKDDGTVEKHKVKVENGYAVFETDHFSTYVLGETGNPNTSDSIIKYLAVFIISTIGLFTTAYYLNTKKA